MTTVDNQLKLLISLYEEEKIQLQKMIDECLVETEYLMAHYHSQALSQINSKLQTLKNLDDNLFDYKNFRQKRIDSIQKELEFESLDYIKEYHLRDIQQLKEELEKLNQISNLSVSKNNVELLEETLKKLLDKKVKNLTLILQKTNNLVLRFSYSKNVLKVTLPHVRQHKKKWILSNYDIEAFEKLGFNLTENETKLVLILTGDKESILNHLKLILSKVVFEIFYFREFENESYIVFTEKAYR